MPWVIWIYDRARTAWLGLTAAIDDCQFAGNADPARCGGSFIKAYSSVTDFAAVRPQKGSLFFRSAKWRDWPLASLRCAEQYCRYWSNNGH
jgi:hypothetical protein